MEPDNDSGWLIDMRKESDRELYVQMGRPVPAFNGEECNTDWPFGVICAHPERALVYMKDPNQKNKYLQRNGSYVRYEVLADVTLHPRRG